VIFIPIYRPIYIPIYVYRRSGTQDKVPLARAPPPICTDIYIPICIPIYTGGAGHTTKPLSRPSPPPIQIPMYTDIYRYIYRYIQVERDTRQSLSRALLAPHTNTDIYRYLPICIPIHTGGAGHTTKPISRAPPMYNPGQVCICATDIYRYVYRYIPIYTGEGEGRSSATATDATYRYLPIYIPIYTGEEQGRISTTSADAGWIASSSPRRHRCYIYRYIYWYIPICMCVCVCVCVCVFVFMYTSIFSRYIPIYIYIDIHYVYIDISSICTDIITDISSYLLTLAPICWLIISTANSDISRGLLPLPAVIISTTN
jgi:hypothetical protein